MKKMEFNHELIKLTASQTYARARIVAIFNMMEDTAAANIDNDIVVESIRAGQMAMIDELEKLLPPKEYIWLAAD